MTLEMIEQLSDLRKERSEIVDRICHIKSQLDAIERQGTVRDRVRGGLGGMQTFHIEGFPCSAYDKKKMALEKRKLALIDCEERILSTIIEIESEIAKIDDSRIRRILCLRVVDGNTWQEVADKIGGGNTEDSVRKAYKRYFC